MTTPEPLETSAGRTTASKQVQEQLNKQWEEKIYPIVYDLFKKNVKPNKKGEYVELRKRHSVGQRCDLNSLEFKAVEVACNPSITLPLKPEALKALFEGRGTQRALDSLSRQVLCECCKMLNAAGYRPETTSDINEHKQYFEKFISRIAERYGDEIYAGLTMSPITVLPADDTGWLSDNPEEYRQPRIGMIVFLEITLWVRADEYTIYPTQDNTLDTIIKEWPQEVN